MSDIKLPELPPVPFCRIGDVLGGASMTGLTGRSPNEFLYTADQLREYAKQAAELERERCEQECELVELEAARMAKEGGTAVDDGRALGARECIDAIRGTK